MSADETIARIQGELMLYMPAGYDYRPLAKRIFAAGLAVGYEHPDQWRQYTKAVADVLSEWEEFFPKPIRNPFQ